ncbi:MAG: aldo/keto reductase, partial [Defluviitaleaceae bacterium]|nr:aldo/keto reductase [Defluviitaleaceae bacterium]
GDIQMIYNDFGNTGLKLSNLGFGCMRLPMTKKDGEEIVDDELAIPLLQRAVELGVNFFDSHWFYCNYDSQRAVGKALSKVRDQVYISTKIAMWLVEKSEDFDTYLERALEQMGLEYLDFYHFPYLSYPTWKDKILPLKLIDRAEKAKAKGLIRHLSFSFHSDVDKMHELVDTGAFSSVMGQYNLVDRENEDFFAYAKDKGLGTIVMSPVMGGVLTDGGKTFLERMQSDASTAAEMALRFVWGLPSVDMALSGMSTLQQLEENVAYANKARDIPAGEWQGLVDRGHALKSLNDLYCTNCNYCHECPQNIKIGEIFQLYLQHNVWGLSDAVRGRRGGDMPFGLEVAPDICTDCGFCIERCPQKIGIPAELKRVWPVLMEI